jgi:hypothetical protein
MDSHQQSIGGLEKEMVRLNETIQRLTADLALAKQVENTCNSLLGVIQGPDWLKWRRALAKKYHPDLNSDKMFTASEVMADINPLLSG